MLLTKLCTCAVLCITIAFNSGGCAEQSEFDHLYNHYFQKHSKDVDGIYRDYYDRWLFRGEPTNIVHTRSLWSLYHAFHGDPAAAHAFFHHPDQDVPGAPGEGWVYDCLILLLRLGDDRFSELLAREDAQTRKAVGASIESQIDWNLHRFPKTRSLYAYRFVRKSAKK